MHQKFKQFMKLNHDNSFNMVNKMKLKQLALIFLAISFATINQGQAIEYKDPVILQKAVNAGSLPKIGERLPKDPKVIAIGSIGK